jgi:hypothetical protein
VSRAPPEHCLLHSHDETETTFVEASHTVNIVNDSGLGSIGGSGKLEMLLPADKMIDEQDHPAQVLSFGIPTNFSPRCYYTVSSSEASNSTSPFNAAQFTLV